MKNEQEPTAMPPKKQQRSLIKAFAYAFEGIAYTIKTQRNMKIHLCIGACALVASALLRLAPLEWALIIVCIGLVLMTELLNTAIEAIVDLLSPEYHHLAKAAKDIGAGMVLVFSLIALIVGCIVFVSAFLRLIGQ